MSNKSVMYLILSLITLQANANLVFAAKDWCIFDPSNPPCRGARGKCTINKDYSLGGFVANTASVERTRHWPVRNRPYIGQYSQICEEARVLDRAQIRDFARVTENARVSEKAVVSGVARVSDYAQVSGQVRVSERAWVFGNATIKDQAEVRGAAYVFGDAVVGGNATVRGKAKVYGNARIAQFAIVEGVAEVDNALISGETRIGRIPQFFQDTQTHGDYYDVVDQENDRRFESLRNLQRLHIFTEILSGSAGRKPLLLSNSARSVNDAPAKNFETNFQFSPNMGVRTFSKDSRLAEGENSTEAVPELVENLNSSKGKVELTTESKETGKSKLELLLTHKNEVSRLIESMEKRAELLPAMNQRRHKSLYNLKKTRRQLSQQIEIESQLSSLEGEFPRSYTRR